MVLRIFKGIWRKLWLWTTSIFGHRTTNAPPLQVDLHSPPYPEYCLRGLRKRTHITENGLSVSSSAFHPDERTATGRQDNAFETSVDWEDEKETLSFVLNRFDLSTHGVARVAFAEIHSLSTIPHPAGSFGYERRPEPDDKYHGNLLFRQLPKPNQAMIAAALALRSELITRPDTG
jgi:hypothetical protein